MNLVDYELSNDEDSDEDKSNSLKKEKDLKEIENLCNKNVENEKPAFKIKEVDNKKPNYNDAKNGEINLYNDNENDKDGNDKNNNTSRSGHNYNMIEGEEKLKNINKKMWDNIENDCNRNILEKNNIMNVNVDENNFDEVFYLPENKYSEILNKKIDDLSKLYDINLTINKNIINSNEYKNPCILEKIMEMFDIDVYSSNYPSDIYNPHDFLSVDLFNEKENPTDRNKAKSKWSEMM